MIHKIGLASDLHDVSGSHLTRLNTINAWFSSNAVSNVFWLGDMMDAWNESGMLGLFANAYADGPNYWIPGNHDEGEFRAALPTYQRVDTASCDIRVDLGNVVFLCFNDVNGGYTITATTLAWLASELAKCAGKYVVLMCHLTINSNGSDEGDIGVVAANGDAVIQIMDNAIDAGIKIRAVIFGHGHASLYAPPNYDYSNGVGYYEIDAAQDGDNAAILLINDSDGSFEITGLGAQKVFKNELLGSRYVLTPQMGAISVNSLVGKSSVEQIYPDITGDPPTVLKITIDGDPAWASSTSSSFKGSVLYGPGDRFEMTLETHKIIGSISVVDGQYVLTVESITVS